MNYQIEEHIIQLLKEHDCVVLPNFGGFILQKEKAEFTDLRINPPNKRVGFNPGIKIDDGLITGKLMGDFGLSYVSAQNEVAKYANNVAYLLKKNKNHSISGIGSFHLSENNNIKFQSTINAMLDTRSFGLPSLQIEPLPEQLISSAKPKRKTIKALKNERKAKSRRLPAKVALSAVLLLIAGVLSLMISDTEIKGLQVNEASFSNILFPESAEYHQNEINRRRPKITHSPRLINGREQAQLEVVPDVLSVSNPGKPKGYYLVVVSYSSKENAAVKEKMLFEIGMDSYILPSNNGFYRVGIYLSPSLPEAYSLYEQSQDEYKNSWLIKNE